MRFSEKLTARVQSANSRLCVGLDPRPAAADGLSSLPDFLRKVVEETAPFAAAYKPNMAYFEAMGIAGLQILEALLADMPREIPIILDAKRGDIGETQKYYASAYFKNWNVDAVTLSPFMGYDTLEPFLDWTGKGIYLLGVTSNPGSADIQRQKTENGRVFELVNAMCDKARTESRATDVGLVVGLTNAEDDVLSSLSDVPLLIPGLGAQGGDLSLLRGRGLKSPCLVNVSRGILYQDPEKSFAEKARAYAEQIQSAF